MSYKPHTENVPGGIVYFGDPAADKMLSAESVFAYDDSTNTLSVVKIDTTSDVSVGGDLTVGDDVIITGDLTVNGTTTTVNTETVTIADNFIELNSDYTGSAPSANAGIEVNRGTAQNTQIIWEETNDLWEFKYSDNVDKAVAEHIVAGQGLGHADSSYLRTINFDIDELTDTASSASDSDLIAIDDGTSTKKITRGNFISGLGGGTVTSIAIAGTDGIDVDSGSPITTNGTITLGLGNIANDKLANSKIVLKGDSGTEDVDLGEDLTVAGGAGATTVVTATNTVTVNVNVDDSTIEVASDTLQVKDAGITEEKRSRTVDSSFTTGDTISSDINLVTTGSSNVTVNLPTPVSGQIVTIKKIDSASGNVVIGTTGSDTIDGASTKRLYYQYESLTCVAKTGTPNEWFII
jgi:hypothetical protein